MEIRCVWEHHGDDSLIYLENLPGAFLRGCTKEEALAKAKQEIEAYFRWLNQKAPDDITLVIVQEKDSELNIADADSDVLFESEKTPFTQEEYHALKKLVMKSAYDFQKLYDSIPDQDASALVPRHTFYGAVPLTAREMYEHTKSVNSYYFAEIDVDADNEGSIAECRKKAFDKLEAQPDYLHKGVIMGSYGEEWTLRKLMRRFLWHDRIHAKAMVRMASKTFGKDKFYDTFRFN